MKVSPGVAAPIWPMFAKFPSEALSVNSSEPAVAVIAPVAMEEPETDAVVPDIVVEPKVMAAAFSSPAIAVEPAECVKS